MSSAPPYIGIDFGTTNSSMAWFNPRTGQAEIIRNQEGEEKTPSLVYFGQREKLVGAPVQNLIEDYKHDADGESLEEMRRIVRSVKRNLKTRMCLALPGGLDIRPVDAVAEILRKLKRDAETEHFDMEVSRAVITYPAVFDAVQRKKITEAAEKAGFLEVKMLEEPIAAALAFARSEQKVGDAVLVYDLGGGTFDLAVVVRDDEGFRVGLETDGDAECGGDDFDQSLYDYWDAQALRELGVSVSAEEGRVNLPFLRECRRRKEILSMKEQSAFSSLLPGGVRFKPGIDRPTFEGLIREKVSRTVRKTAAMIKRAQEEGIKVDTLVMIGGSSRLPLIQQMLKESLQITPRAWSHKDVAVALGAAYYAEQVWAAGESKAGHSRPQTLQGTGTATLKETTTRPVLKEQEALASTEKTAAHLTSAMQQTLEDEQRTNARIHELEAMVVKAIKEGRKNLAQEYKVLLIEAREDLITTVERLLTQNKERLEAQISELKTKMAAAEKLRRPDIVDAYERVLVEAREDLARTQAQLEQYQDSKFRYQEIAANIGASGAPEGVVNEETLIQILERNADNFLPLKLYIRPDIPFSQRDKAKSLNLIPPGEKILGVLTVNGSNNESKLGIIIGSQALYFNNAWERARGQLSYSAFKDAKFSVRYPGRGKERIHIDDLQPIAMGFEFTPGICKALFDLLGDIKKTFWPARPVQQKSATPPAPNKQETMKTSRPLFSVEQRPSFAPSAQEIAARKEADMLALLMKYQQSIKGMHTHPVIPASKLRNARGVCSVPEQVKVLGLVDVSLFGTAKDCVLFTLDAMYFRYWNIKAGGKAAHQPYEALIGATFTAKGTSVYSNNGMHMLMGTDQSTAQMCKLLEELIPIATR